MKNHIENSIFASLIAESICIYVLINYFGNTVVGKWYDTDKYAVVVGFFLAANICASLWSFSKVAPENLSFTFLGQRIFGSFFAVTCVAGILYFTQMAGGISRLWFVIASCSVVCVAGVTAILWTWVWKLRPARRQTAVKIVGTAPEYVQIARDTAVEMGCKVVVEEVLSNIPSPAKKKGDSYQEVWIADSEELDGELLNELVSASHSPIIFLSQLKLIPTKNWRTFHVGPIMGTRISGPPLSLSGQLIKRSLDVAVSVAGIIALTPLMLCIALAVKLQDGGPVFYKQERLTWNGLPFTMLKFRTMAVKHQNDTVVWGQESTKPITSVGAFLRRFSLDEIPQLLNVLRGDMSLVGPRPERSDLVGELSKAVPRYMQKHLVKAGMTGWAQINGLRGHTSLQDRIDHDLAYIENWSLSFDLYILVMTPYEAFVKPALRKRQVI